MVDGVPENDQVRVAPASRSDADSVPEALAVPETALPSSLLPASTTLTSNELDGVVMVKLSMAPTNRGDAGSLLAILILMLPLPSPV